MLSVKLTFTALEFEAFLQMLLHIEDCKYESGFEKQVIKMVVKKLALKLLPRKFTLKQTKNAVQLSAIEAICINKILFQLPVDDFEQAVAVLISTKIQQLCSLNI